MNLTAKSVNTLGFVGIAIMLMLLALLWFRVVPESWTIPFFIVALSLFLTRLVLRVLLIRKEKHSLQKKKNAQTHV